MGEVIVVLNGVEFRTRHNDYRLRMPHRTSFKQDANEDIPFPDVPEAVTSKRTVGEQIIEMREWFKAWQTQNSTVRNYKLFFKPVLCYLEGAWTNNDDVKDAAFGARHFTDASSWFDVQEKARFASYSGIKNNEENYPYLPTTIIGIKNGLPVFAQWKYKILCHPIKRNLPLNRFRVVDDLSRRIMTGKSLPDFAEDRQARFQLNPMDTNVFKDKQTKYGLLDRLMYEIPGKNNYQARIYENSTKSKLFTGDDRADIPLNTGYYSRGYRISKKDAMGQKFVLRGFSDDNLFVASTTQPKVASVSLNDVTRRYSYAIPLEIIYLTPLNSWNPYDLEYKSGKLAKTVTDGKRKGKLRIKSAFNGTNSKLYYLTPSSFFGGADSDVDAADTGKSTVGVLDRHNAVRKVRPSGIYINLPDIPGVGKVRLRYPIMPVHGEGSTVWKELEATVDILKSVFPETMNVKLSCKTKKCRKSRNNNRI